MLKTLKKIVLFLFGIVLLVFGNKAAINTIFAEEDKTDNKKQTSDDMKLKTSVIEEEVKTDADNVSAIDKTEEKTITTSAKSENRIEKKQPESVPEKKQQAEKTVAVKTIEAEKVPIKESEENIKKESIKETPVTTIEPEQPEPASGTE